jgi:hypothetical protein
MFRHDPNLWVNEGKGVGVRFFHYGAIGARVHDNAALLGSLTVPVGHEPVSGIVKTPLEVLYRAFPRPFTATVDGYRPFVTRCRSGREQGHARRPLPS